MSATARGCTPTRPPSTIFAFLNVDKPPFNDARVRRALNYAVDRGRLAELLGSRQTHVPTCQLLPPGFPGYTPACPFTVNPNPAGTWTGPDLERARRLIAASGTRGMKVEFWGVHGLPLEPVGRYFRSVLSKLGYRASLHTIGDLHPIGVAASGPAGDAAATRPLGLGRDLRGALRLRGPGRLLRGDREPLPLLRP